MKALLGTKIGMTQVISKDGTVTPITLVQAGPTTVTQIKTIDNDGYNAVQVAYGEGKNLSKATIGHVKPSNTTPKHIKEIRTADLPADIKIGDKFDVEAFSLNDVVAVTGISKGKGFAGAIKRHNFSRQAKSHGGKGDTRKVGSIGSMYPQKIFKGKKMAGRMGHDQVTVKNLKVAYIDKESNLLGVTGAIPGPRRSLVIIKGETL